MMDKIFKKSELMMDEYLASVSDDEFLALYDSVEDYEGLTVPKWLGAIHSSHFLGGDDMGWLTEATEEQLKEADEIAKNTWKNNTDNTEEEENDETSDN